jgi:hypothetical protein
MSDTEQMNNEKLLSLNNLRVEFVKFMEAISVLPGSQLQKQQAFLRFDEGHMWMQNSIITHVKPAPIPDEAINE